MFKYLSLLVFISACSGPQGESTPYTRGKAVYNSECTSCHNTNPDLDGSVGPALRGSSYALIYNKLILGTYPEGYTPKRNSNLMSKFTGLYPDTPDLYFYLK